MPGVKRFGQCRESINQPADGSLAGGVFHAAAAVSSYQLIAVRSSKTRNDHSDRNNTVMT